MKHQETNDNETRLEQLNRRLTALRKVNRLINHAKDSSELLQGACDCLTETQGYFNAWIALLDSGRRLLGSYESGLGEAFLPMVAQLHTGRLTRCALRALDKKAVTTTGDPGKTCSDCPLSGGYRGRSAMTVRIAHRDRVFGLLSVSIPKSSLEEKEECNLLAELAEDLGYALFSLDTQKHLWLHRHITRDLPNPMAVLDTEYRYQTVNEAYSSIYGKDPSEIVGQCVGDFYQTGFFENNIRPNLDRCLAGEDVHYEILFQAPHADTRWMEMHYSPYRNSNGSIAGVVSLGTDITEQKQKKNVLKQRLKELEAFHSLSRLLEQRRDLHAILRETLDIVIDAMQYPEIARARIRYDNNIYKSHQMCLPDCHECTEASLSEPLLVDGKSRGELRLCYMEASSLPEKAHFLPAERRLVHAIAERLGHTCERYRAEQALRYSKTRLRHMGVMLDMAPASITVHTTDGQFLYANQATASLHGYSHEKFMTLKLSEIDDEKSKGQLRQRMEQLVNQGEAYFEVAHRRKDGTTFPLKVSARMVDWDGTPAVLGVAADITERKLAEKEMRLTLKAVSEGIWKWHLKTNELEFSPVYYTMLGYEPGEFPATVESWKRLIHPDDQEDALQTAETYLKTGRDVYENIFRMQTKQGHYRWIQAKGRVVERDAAGAMVRIIGNHLDITDRVNFDKRLRHIQRRNQSLLDHSPVCHKIVDLDFNLTYMSLNGFKMLKVDETDTVYGKPYPFAFFPEAFRNEMKKALKEVKRTGCSVTMEALACDVDGHALWLDSNLLPVFNDEGEIVYITVVSANTTERKKADEEKANLEKQVRQIQKMESIGNLAGGIAHDFNNILFPIMGLSELLLDDLPLDSFEHESAQRILEAAERGRDLVQQILAFSRKTEHEMLPIRLQGILKEVIKLCRSTIPTNIEIKQNIQTDCGLILGDETQIHQIGMNLITNAYHAVQDAGGRISVYLKEIKLDSEDVPIASLKPGRYAMITVEDTGSGIDPDHMEKIFDPYFTTKEHGKGTGLGLAVAHGIIHEHGGDIRAYSELGKGTVFNVYLPLIEKPVKRKSLEKPENLPTGHERILLVDDEEAIVHLERQILKRLGYAATAFKNPMDALKAFQAAPDDFDLVITDMAMPKKTGIQLAVELLAVRPDIPVILSTGFSEHMNAQDAIKMGLKGLLKKPVTKSTLARTVRRVLDDVQESTPSRIR